MYSVILSSQVGYLGITLVFDRISLLYGVLVHLLKVYVVQRTGFRQVSLGGERHCESECFAQEHNTMTPESDLAVESRNENKTTTMKSLIDQ